MVWRHSTTALDRLWAALVYLIPLYDGLLYGQFLFRQFPPLAYLGYPLLPLALVYSALPLGLGSLLVFILLFVAVVRNEKVPHFIRFNTMQAILLSIVLTLVTLVYNFVLAPLVQGFLQEVLFNTVFLAVLAAVGYGMVQSARGRYPEIPVIAEASYLQIR
ncbi:MAG: Tic20 family protein [Gloeomargarita sp. GMQP_bins_120]